MVKIKGWSKFGNGWTSDTMITLRGTDYFNGFIHIEDHNLIIISIKRNSRKVMKYRYNAEAKRKAIAFMKLHPRGVN